MRLTASKKTLVRSILLGIASVVLGMVISKKLAQPKETNKPPISFRESKVGVISSYRETYPISLVSSGRLKAANRFDIFTEVTGKIQNNNFREGSRFNKGQAILKIESSEFDAQLNALRSNFLGTLSQVLADINIDYPRESKKWEEYASNVNAESTLTELPKIQNSKLKNFLSGRGILNQYYQIKSQEVRAGKFQLFAPYNGVLSETSIEPGALVRAGQKIGTFIEPNSYELEASIPETQLDYLKVGQRVQLKGESRNHWGRVQRINQVVDAQTQMVKAYISVKGSTLKEGQYLSVVVEGKSADKSMRIPRKLLNNGTLWLVSKQDSSLYKQPVKIESIEGETAIVSHMDTGLWMVNRPVPGAFKGMKVTPILESESK